MSVAVARVGSVLRGRGALLVAIVVLAVFAYALIEVQTWSTRSRLFATTIGVPAILLAVVQVAREARRLGVAPEIPREALFTRSALVWAVAFFVSLWMLGLVVTVPLFALVYLRFAAGESWPKAAVYAAATWLFIELLFIRLLHVPLPGGAIPLPAITP